MAEPCIREVGRGIRVAALARLEHVLLERNALGWIVNRDDVVHAVAVVAHRFVGGGLGIGLLEQGDRGTVEIGNVGVHDLGGNAILAHLLGIGMALAAHLGGRVDAETGRIGALNNVHTVAVGAGRHVRILVLGDAAAMHAVEVLFVNRIVAARADFGDCGMLHRGRAAVRVGLDWRLAVGIVAVGTDRGIAVAAVQQLGMDAVGKLLRLVRMALLAGVLVLQCVAAGILGRIFWMGEAGNIGVAHLAGDVGVGGLVVHGRVNRYAQHFAAGQGIRLAGFAVTGQAGAVIRLLCRRRVGLDASRRCRQQRHPDAKQSNQDECQEWVPGAHDSPLHL